MDVNVAVLLGSVAGAAAEALEKAAGAQTRPAHSPTGTALRWRGRGGGRQGAPERRTWWQEGKKQQKKEWGGGSVKTGNEQVKKVEYLRGLAGEQGWVVVSGVRKHTQRWKREKQKQMLQGGQR